MIKGQSAHSLFVSGQDEHRNWNCLFSGYKMGGACWTESVSPNKEMGGKIEKVDKYLTKTRDKVIY